MDRARMPLGTIREDWLMVLYPPIFTLSLYIRSFSAACEAHLYFEAFAAHDPEGTPVVLCYKAAL
jgi:hypothetical protein